MGFLAAITNVAYAVKAAAEGKAIIITTEAPGGQERTTELYHPPGISSAPSGEDRTVCVDIGTGKKVGVATHNYRIEIEATAGETIVYSTDPDGEELRAQIKLDTEGNITLNGKEEEAQIKLDSEGNITLNGKEDKAQIKLDSEVNITLNGKEEKAQIKLDAEGNITLNGGTNSAVNFKDFNSTIEKFIKDYKSHTHTCPQGTTEAPLKADALIIDFSSAEVKKVKL